MHNQKAVGVALITLAMVIWGFTVVMHKTALDYLGPYTYLGVRFLLSGGVMLLMAKVFDRHKREKGQETAPFFIQGKPDKVLFTAGLIMGLVLAFHNASQQVGLVYTTASKSAFICSLYVAIVPVIAVLLKQKVEKKMWLATLIMLVGLYFLSITPGMDAINKGDALVFFSAFFWAIQIFVVDRYNKRVDNIKMLSLSFTVCGIFCIIPAFIMETITWQGILDCAIPILYSTLLCSCVGYLCQMEAQKRISPVAVSLILIFCSVVAAVGSYFVLNEALTSRELLGCSIMFVGLLLSQAPLHPRNKTKPCQQMSALK